MSPSPFVQMPSPCYKCRPTPKLKYSWNRIPVLPYPRQNFLPEDINCNSEPASINNNASPLHAESLSNKKKQIPLLNLGSIKN